MSVSNTIEKRAHRRLDIHLPLSFHKKGLGRSNNYNTTTINVSTGGAYFETTADDVAIGDKLALELEIPVNDGRFPPQGKIVAEGEVIRCVAIEDESNKEGLSFP
ncbi:MAG: PilZ domain-containing protein, partial [Planctomycetes bacterium]|nr:PilZ domain-containing protein [Planctomycetota bacterium]